MSIPPVMLLIKACLWILVVIGMIELNGFELIGIFSSYNKWDAYERMLPCRKNPLSVGFGYNDIDNNSNLQI